MIQNRNMTRAAKKRVWVSPKIGLAAAYTEVTETCGFVDPENNILIRRIDLIYCIASDGSATVDTINVGIVGTLGKYAAIVTAISQTAGTVQAATLLNPTVEVAAGTAVLVSKSGHAGTNTGGVQVAIHYEIIDGDPRP